MAPLKFLKKTSMKEYEVGLEEAVRSLQNCFNRRVAWIVAVVDKTGSAKLHLALTSGL